MAKIRDGSTYLSNHLTANDYYSEGEKIAGRWLGKLAEKFGLLGNSIAADDAAFENLRANLTPDGTVKLTPRQPEIRFFDFQCSAQKSVSVMAVTVGDERLRMAHQRAFAIAFDELERFAAARVRKGAAAWSNDTCMTGNVCAAVFQHDASRALDPQLHAHAVVANATFDAGSERITALSEFEMVRAIRYAGKVYQNELARGVQRLGYEVEITRNGKGEIQGFEIQGVNAAILERFSKRREEVERGIKAFRQRVGRDPLPAEIHEIATATRSFKLKEITTPEVLAAQRAQLTFAELQSLEQLKIAAITRADGVRQGAGETPALDEAVKHLYERASVLRGHQVLAEALNQRLGTVDLDQLKASAARGDAELVCLADCAENPLLSAEFATREGLRLEKWAVEFVNQTKGKCEPLGDEATFNFSEKLGADQKEAARLMVTSPDQVAAVRGVAGAGKTTLLVEVDKTLRALGHKAFYIAPTASAAKVLKSEGFADATTCSDFLRNVSAEVDLTGAVVICDEAGLQSNRQGAQLLKLAELNQMRVRFVGDSRQHVSVEAGDFLRVLEQHSQLVSAEVGTIRRQRVAEYRDAVIAMATGDAAGGLVSLDELGWVKEGRADYIRAAARDYIGMTANGDSLDSCIAVAPTWVENFRLTDEIRGALKSRGKFGEGKNLTVHDSLKWTVQQKRNAANYRQGMIVSFAANIAGFRKGRGAEVLKNENGKVTVGVDGVEKRLRLDKAAHFAVATPRSIEVLRGEKILIRANDKPRGLVNGDVLTVENVAADGTISTREGITIAADFRHWCHGYVVTSHKSQGRTADHVVVAAERLDAKAAYVACSRGRYSVALHTPDKQRLMDRLPRGDRTAALDVAGHRQARQSAERPTVLARATAWLARQARDFSAHLVGKTGGRRRGARQKEVAAQEQTHRLRAERQAKEIVTRSL